jgi:hypothetical protein
MDMLPEDDGPKSAWSEELEERPALPPEDDEWDDFDGDEDD